MRVSGEYYEVHDEQGREIGTVLGGGPTRDTRFKSISPDDVGIAPLCAPGGYSPTLEEAAALLAL